jgi:hypothetical protein
MQAGLAPLAPAVVSDVQERCAHVGPAEQTVLFVTGRRDDAWQAWDTLARVVLAARADTTLPRLAARTREEGRAHDVPVVAELVEPILADRGFPRALLVAVARLAVREVAHVDLRANLGCSGPFLDARSPTL